MPHQKKQVPNQNDRDRYELSIYEWSFFCILSTIENLQSVNIETLSTSFKERNDIILPPDNSLSDIIEAFVGIGALIKKQQGLYSLSQSGKKILTEYEANLAK